MQSGSIRLFQISGITVYLHFSWFFVAVYQITRPNAYRSPVFAFYEYLALFGLVLMHEFGHALACRQTGGVADRIMLWPLGGIAFVRPPQRPGAQLWAIAAGPLVNVVLIPILLAATAVALALNWRFVSPDTYRLIRSVAFINVLILCFNLLPIYPLDGGQILRSLLWFPLGAIRSLQIVTVLGFVTIPIAVLVGIYTGFLTLFWGAILGFFLFSQAVAGWRHAQGLALAEEEANLGPAEVKRPPML
jgi:Zn-dependent protease